MKATFNGSNPLTRGINHTFRAQQNPAKAPIKLEAEGNQGSNASEVISLPKATLETLRAYNPVRFGSGPQQGFDLQKYLAKDITGGLEDAWNQAVQSSEGKEVTPEDLFLGMIRDFEKDLKQYTESTDKRNYFASSYFGKALGMNNSLRFVEDKQPMIDWLHKVGQELELHLKSLAVPTEAQSHAPGEPMKKYFQASKNLLNTILTQAPQKLTTTLVGEEVLLQIFSKQDGGMAGKLARLFFEESRVKPEIDLEEFLTDSEKAQDAVDADAKKPINLSQQAEKPDFKGTPGINGQLGEVLERLKWNRTRYMTLQIPKSLNPDKVVDTLAAVEASKVVNNAGETPVKFFRVNVSKFFEGTDNAQPLEKLKQGLKDLLRENGPSVVHLQNLESNLRKLRQELDPSLLETLSQNGKLKFIFTQQNTGTITTRMGHEQEEGSLLSALVPNMAVIPIEAPSSGNTAAFVKEQHLSELKKQHPGVQFTDEAIQKAVDMAVVTRELLLETALEFLDVAAQRFPQGPLTAEKLSRAVKQDPHLGYSTKVSLSGTYQRLGETELSSLLENSPPIVGMDKAKAFFSKMMQGIQDPAKFEAYGLTPVTRAIIAGPSGTAKTQLAMQFAKEQKMPMVYISGKELANVADNQIPSILHQAFLSAKNESKRKETRGESPQVMVMVDNLEGTATPVGNGPGGVTQVKNPIIGAFLEELKKLKEEENPHILTLGVTNSNMGFHPAFQSPEYIDEVVKVDPPNLEERETILKNLAKQSEKRLNRQLYSPTLDYNKASRRLTGVTGKTMETVLSKARERAMVDGKNPSNMVENKHLDEAITMLTLGAENRKLYNILTPDDRRATAYHEGGHALTFQKMKEYLGQTALELLKVTIMPQGPALGVTFYVPEAEFHTQTKTQLFAQLVSVVASLPAEQLSLHDVTTGNSNDRQVATQIAAQMVTQVAMGKNKIVYPIENASDLNALPQEVRDEMSFLINQAEQVAEVIIRGYAPFMEQLVDRLAGPDGKGGEDTLQAEEFKKMLVAFEKTNPKAAQSVHKQVHKLMTPVFPERFPQTLWRRLLSDWFGVQPKPVFREVERLNKAKTQSNPKKP